MRSFCRVLRLFSFSVFVALWGGGASGALVPYAGGKLLYDTDRDITWVADANLCLTLNDCVNGDSSGGMLWTDANLWAADLEYLGYRDWRLPTAIDLGGGGPCLGFNCTGSEMGHLFYIELGLSASLNGDALTNTGPFTNIQSTRYWSSTGYAPGSTGIIAAWEFSFTGGFQGYEAFGGTDDYLVAWAVRDGKPRGVPEPSSLALVGISLAGLAALRRRNKQAT